MRLVGVVAEAAFAVGFVFAVVAVKILDMAVALERQNVRCDAVQKPAIVTNYDRAAGKVFERLFESTHCVDIDVVGRLIEQQDVGTSLEHFGEVDAITLTAR